MTARFCSPLTLLMFSLAAPAGAADLPCGAVERDSIHIDGLQSDWEGVPDLDLPVHPVPGAPPQAGRPLSAFVRCNYDSAAIYLWVQVDDDILLRTAAAGPGEDHLELGFAGAGGQVERLSLWPAAAAQRLPRVARWSSGRPLRLTQGEGPAGRAKPLKGPPVMEVYEALQPKGYAVELRLPFSLLPGFRRGMPLPLAIRVVDGDSRVRPQAVAVAETAPLESAAGLSLVQLAEVAGALEALLADLKLGEGDVWWDKPGNVGTGPARILMVGRYLAVLAKEYGYLEAAKSRDEVKEVQLVELGDGKQAVLLRTEERGGGGGREVLRLWALRGGQFEKIFGAEVGKRLGAGALRTQVSLVRRGKGTDLVFTPQPAVGVDAASWNELPAEDEAPMLLPWRDKKVRYVYKGGTYVKAD